MAELKSFIHFEKRMISKCSEGRRQWCFDLIWKQFIAIVQFKRSQIQMKIQIQCSKSDTFSQPPSFSLPHWIVDTVTRRNSGHKCSPTHSYKYSPTDTAYHDAGMEKNVTSILQLCQANFCAACAFVSKYILKIKFQPNIFLANTKVAPLVSSPPHGELQSRQNSRDVRRTHCVRKAGRETTLHFISELCLSDFTVGDVEAATYISELSTAMRAFPYIVKRSFCVLQHEM